MITVSMWQCPLDLIERALIEHPIEGSRTALNRANGNFFYDPWVIKDEFKGTVWEEVLDTIPYSIGEARVITLQPGTTYQAHADIDDRWHLNLQSEESYLINLTDNEMFKLRVDTHWRHMDASKIHSATNFGSIPRIQLVVRKTLTKSKYTKLTAVKIEPAGEQASFRYKFDNLVSPWLNLQNKECTLSDFDYNGTCVTFKLATHKLDELAELLTVDYKLTIDAS